MKRSLYSRSKLPCPGIVRTLSFLESLPEMLSLEDGEEEQDVYEPLPS